MDKKPFVIGLTGNIASGKSVIRNFLANTGAYAIDADLTAQDTYLPGLSAWHEILDHFGDDLRMADDQINRSKLGRIVFSDPTEMAVLEKIVHPRVNQMIVDQVQNCSKPVLVIEAIKLLESEICLQCDQIWTAAAAENIRFERLVEYRGQSETLAWQKIRSQPPQEEKITRSDVVIWTDRSYKDTYQQTIQALTASNLPLHHSVQSDALLLSTLLEEDFSFAKDLLENHTNQIWTEERLYQQVGNNLMPVLKVDGEVVQVERLGTRQTLALLTNQTPLKTEQANSLDLIPLLEVWLGGAISLLAIRREAMTPKEAWQADYFPGEDGVDHTPAQTYLAFLKEHGLMPGEVWVKPLKSNQAQKT